MKITVKSGIGREVNPHTYYEDDIFLSYAYIKFKQQHPEYPCFSTTGEPVEDYQGEAELVWQAKKPNSTKWFDISADNTYKWDKTRRVARLKQGEEVKQDQAVEQKDINVALIDNWRWCKAEIAKLYNVGLLSEGTYIETLEAFDIIDKKINALINS